MTEEDLIFVNLVTRSLRGSLSPDEQAELNSLIDSDTARRVEAEQLIVNYHLLSLCAAAEAQPREVPVHLLEQLRSAVDKNIKPKKAKWRFGPTTALWASGLAAALVIGMTTLVYRHKSDKVHVEYALQRNTQPVLSWFQYSGVAADSLRTADLKDVLNGAVIQEVENENALQDWKNNWSESNRRPVFKILIQERGTWNHLKSKFAQSEIGQVQVTGRWRGANFQKTFSVTSADAWPQAIKDAQVFINDTVQQQLK